MPIHQCFLNMLSINSSKRKAVSSGPEVLNRGVSYEKLEALLRRHIEHVATSAVKLVNKKEDTSELTVVNSFDQGRKEQLLGMLEYGVDIFAPFCLGPSDGKESWIIDFYGRKNSAIPREALQIDKDIILKAYRKQKWKISLVGGTVAHWNRRRHFVLFLEKYVIDVRNNELRERRKDVLSIVIVQSAIMSYL